MPHDVFVEEDYGGEHCEYVGKANEGVGLGEGEVFDDVGPKDTGSDET